MSDIPVNVLSLDGGGVRGLAALDMLKHLMRSINLEREKNNLPLREPWQLFEMIGGTGTGGYEFRGREPWSFPYARCIVLITFVPRTSSSFGGLLVEILVQSLFVLTHLKLIAVILGRLRMSISECITAYKTLSDAAFTEKNLVERAYAKLTIGSHFKTETLAREIQKVINDAQKANKIPDGPADPLFWEEKGAACKV